MPLRCSGLTCPFCPSALPRHPLVKVLHFASPPATPGARWPKNDNICEYTLVLTECCGGHRYE